METDLFIAPNEDDIKEMQRQWEEDAEKMEHLVSLFRIWLNYQTHLPQNFSNAMLKQYIRACKMDLEKAKKKIEVLCYLPVTHEKFFANRKLTSEGDLKALDYAYLLPLPQLTSEGYRITVFKIIDGDNIQLLPILRYVAMIADYRIHKEVFNAGDVIIVDMEFMRPYMYAKFFTPMLLHVLKLSIEAYPCRLKQIFITSCHPLLEKGVNLCKAVLSEKLRNRIFLLNSSADLCKYISEKFLPSDYNGIQHSLETLNKGWKELMLRNVELFESISKMKPKAVIPKYIVKYDESLGIDGSFRKLNID